jgi:hypothetical protein
MRVRISFDALRLCLLVAAGVTSGYLWRAAFESSSPLEARVEEQPRIIEPAPAPPVVRIAPHHLTTTKGPAVLRHVVRTPVGRPEQRSTGPLITSHAPSAQPSPPAATPPSPTPATPTPTPPKPSPAPTQTTPTPATPPTQTTTPTTVASPPAQAASPTPASQPSSQPSNAPNLGASQDDDRPGWGKGDKNHDHSGPGGKGK